MESAIDKRKELLHISRMYGVMYLLSTSCMTILARKTAYHLFWNDPSIIIRSVVEQVS